ncbi:MAG: hypothetical protein ACHBN1_05085 [Heteroscytonema crispum UTEX LB 1556]
MNSPLDDIDLLIADLGKIRQTLASHEVQQVRSSVPHLNKAINILTRYKASRNQQEFEPEPRPEKPKVQNKTVQKKQLGNCQDFFPILYRVPLSKGQPSFQ